MSSQQASGVKGRDGCGQPPCPTQGHHAGKGAARQQRLTDVWTPQCLARAQCGAGFPVPSNPAVTNHPALANPANHHYNLDAMAMTPSPVATWARHNIRNVFSSPIIIGGVNINEVTPRERFIATSASNSWEDPSLGRSGYRPSQDMLLDMGNVTPVALDFSPASKDGMGDEVADMNPGSQATTLAPASPVEMKKKRRCEDPDTKSEMRKKAKVQDWLLKNFKVIGSDSDSSSSWQAPVTGNSQNDDCQDVPTGGSCDQ